MGAADADGYDDDGDGISRVVAGHQLVAALSAAAADAAVAAKPVGGTDLFEKSVGGSDRFEKPGGGSDLFELAFDA